VAVAVPVWLLDIDGVINAADVEPDVRVWPRDQWIRASARSAHDLEWPLLVARSALDPLRRVHDEHLAEIRWHTTWQSYAVNVGEALGLPRWPVAECPEFEGIGR